MNTLKRQRWSLTDSLSTLAALSLWAIAFSSFSVITKLQYKQATPHGAQQLKGLLGYLQHRREAAEVADLPRSGRRWVDRGLGGTFKAIQANCKRLQSQHVLAFTWVIAPNPDCMALVDPSYQQRFVAELTERALDDLFEARGMPTPEYAYIHHTRETEDPTAPGRLHPHAHIILAGSYEDALTGQRQPYYMNKSRKKGEDHPDLFWKAAQTEMEQLLERYVGLDWSQRLEQLVAEREQAAHTIQAQEVDRRLAELAQVTASATLQPAEFLPDCWGETADGQLWRGWVDYWPIGAEQHAVGIYWQADDLLANADDTFEPLFTEPDELQARAGKLELLLALLRDPDRGVEALREAAARLQPEPPALPPQAPARTEAGPDQSFSLDWSL
ncbi:MAG: hypothetical protein ACYDBJ_06160 [Aggregatilineales bacterium]